MIFFDKSGNEVVKPEGRSVGKRVSVYGVYIKAEKVLMIRPEWSNLWELPGGGLDAGETLAECLAREFNEETGLVVVAIDEHPLGHRTQLFYADETDEYFEAELNFFRVTDLREGDGVDRSGEGEVEELSFVPVAALDDNNCRAGHLQMIEKAAGMGSL